MPSETCSEFIISFDADTLTMILLFPSLFENTFETLKGMKNQEFKSI